MDDDALLASGDHATLLARYEVVIVARCVAALRGSLDAENVAQDFKLRLWRELQAGKTYPVPFRVVVHKVINWTLKDLGGEGDDAAAPGGVGADGRGRSARVAHRPEMLEELPPREREVWELLIRDWLGHVQIADRLGIERNNVDQALARGRGKLRKKLAGS